MGRPEGCVMLNLPWLWSPYGPLFPLGSYGRRVSYVFVIKRSSIKKDDTTRMHSICVVVIESLSVLFLFWVCEFLGFTETSTNVVKSELPLNYT